MSKLVADLEVLLSQFENLIFFECVRLAEDSRVIQSIMARKAEKLYGSMTASS
jgi:hypothetical protein